MAKQNMERDIIFKDEQFKNIKNIARDVAEELEQVKKREEQFRSEIVIRDESLLKRKQEIDSLIAEMSQVKRHLNDESRENNKMVDMRLDFEAKLDRKEGDIHHLKEEVVKQRDEIRGKDEAIKALSMTLLDKGQENQKLSEMVLEIKNHQLETQILGQKFLV